MAAAFSEPDYYGLGLLNSSTMTGVHKTKLQSAADYDANQSGLQTLDIPIPTDNEMQDMAPPVDNHLPEQPIGSSGGSLDNARPSKATLGFPPPAHEGELMYISKYLVQYVPVKQNKPSSFSRVAGARILTSEECTQIIFECEEKREKRKGKRRKVARE